MMSIQAIQTHVLRLATIFNIKPKWEALSEATIWQQPMGMGGDEVIARTRNRGDQPGTIQPMEHANTSQSQGVQIASWKEKYREGMPLVNREAQQPIRERGLTSAQSDGSSQSSRVIDAIPSGSAGIHKVDWTNDGWALNAAIGALTRLGQPQWMETV
jgi:hypothetical protein